MIQEYTVLNVADNTGARKIRCFKVLGGSRRKYATIGDVIIASVRESDPDAAAGARKGDKVRAVIVRASMRVSREDGSFIKFDDNAAVLVNNQGEPMGTRVFGPVGRELRRKNYMRIVSLAPEVV